MIGSSLTQTSRRGSMRRFSLTNIKEGVHDRLHHTNIKEGVHDKIDQRSPLTFEHDRIHTLLSCTDPAPPLLLNDACVCCMCRVGRKDGPALGK